MDVTVSSIGNADSLQGGILLQTPFLALTIRLLIQWHRDLFQLVECLPVLLAVPMYKLITQPLVLAMEAR